MNASDRYPATYSLSKPIRASLLHDIKGKSSISLDEIRRISRAHKVASKSVHDLFTAHGISILTNGSAKKSLIDQVFGPAVESEEDCNEDTDLLVEVPEKETPGEADDLKKLAEARLVEIKTLEELAEQERAHAEENRKRIDTLEAQSRLLNDEARRATASAREQMERTAALRRETKDMREQLEAARNEAAVWQRRHGTTAAELNVAQHEVARLQEELDGFDMLELKVRRIHAMIIGKRVPDDVDIGELEREFDAAIERLMSKTKEGRLEARTLAVVEELVPPPAALPPAAQPAKAAAQPQAKTTKPAAPKVELWDARDIARKYGVNPSTISNWKRFNSFPDAAKLVDRKLYYNAAAVARWYQEHRT